MTLSATAEMNPDELKLRAEIACLRNIAAPLVSALFEVQGGMADPSESEVTGQNAEQLAALVDSAVGIANAMADELGASSGPEYDWARMNSAAPASQCVAAFYRATGKTLDVSAAESMLAALRDVSEKFPLLAPAPHEPPFALTLFRGKLLEAMVPVIGSVAQYAFGRPEHGLLAEIAERIMQAVEQATRALAPPSANPEEWRTLCYAILKAAGQLYTECHYAEADRLLYMDADERAHYFAQNGNRVPMTRVWQAFDQRVAMLVTLVAYVELPPSARLDAPEWSRG